MIEVLLGVSLLLNIAQLAYGQYLINRLDQTSIRLGASERQLNSALKRLEPFKAYEDQVSR